MSRTKAHPRSRSRSTAKDVSERTKQRLLRNILAFCKAEFDDLGLLMVFEQLRERKAFVMAHRLAQKYQCDVSAKYEED